MNIADVHFRYADGEKCLAYNELARVLALSESSVRMLTHKGNRTGKLQRFKFRGMTLIKWEDTLNFTFTVKNSMIGYKLVVLENGDIVKKDVDGWQAILDSKDQDAKLEKPKV